MGKGVNGPVNINGVKERLGGILREISGIGGAFCGVNGNLGD